MKIKKRSGQLANLDISNIRKQTIPACEGLGVSYETLELAANISFTNCMESKNIQQILIQSALNLTDVDKPNWIYVAGRLYLYDLYHRIKRTYKVVGSGNVYDKVKFSDYVAHNSSKLSYNASLFDMKVLDDTINSELDLQFTYLGINTLEKRYLLKSNSNTLELPQHMLMSLACFLAQNEANPTHWAIKFYEVMSNLEFLPATPTLANGRKLKGNCFSCAVGTTPDNIEGIFDTFKTQAIGSKYGAGWGWDWTRVRALGGTIGDTPDVAGGLVPWLKIENDVAVAVDQLGVRLGAISVSVETWHKDFIDYLDLKKNSGEEKRRAKELFLAASCSDLFMNRVINGETWTMFDPFDTPDLAETFGTEFESRYIKYEELANSNPSFFTNKPTQINAKELWKKMQRYYWEVGGPELFFKDNVNNAHHNPALGIIRSSNLCKEVFLPTNDNVVALCNLGSINLAKVNTVEDMERVIPIAMRMLDNVIDVTTYPIPFSEDNQKHTRAVGLGVAGEAELIANKQIMYGSSAHLDFIEDLYSNFEKISDQASKDLGTARGTWSQTSPYRNAYRRAIAPTSSVSIILGTTAGDEPVFDKVWYEENKMGNFKVTAPHINPNNFQFYVSPYDVNQDDMVRCGAVRQKHLDQGRSHNIYYRPGTTGKQVFDTLILAWKLGYKSTYYLRSEGMKEIKDDKVACVGCAG